MPSFDPPFSAIATSLDAAGESLSLLSDGLFAVFDAYCQLGLATMDAWAKAWRTVGVAFEPPSLQTAEVVRIRPRRA